MEANEASGIDGDGNGEQFDCPWEGCERSFGTEGGLKSHYGASDDHEGSLAGVEVECSQCGGAFRVSPSRSESAKFCSRDCQDQHYKSKRATIKCKRCGDGFEVYSYKEDTAKFCSPECHAEWLSKNNCGEDNYRYKGRVDVECIRCGDVFDTRPARADSAKYCSRDCMRKLEAKETHHCEVCGESFTIYKSSQKTSRFCGQDCYTDWLRENAVSGEDHPQYKAKVEIVCDGCGETFEVHQCRADTAKFCSNSCSSKQEEYNCAWCGENFKARPRDVARRFCSTECAHEWRRENALSGQEHHSWRGGYTIYEAVKKLIRDEPWDTTAARIRERDNHECQVCGKHTSEQDRALTANHIPALLDGGCNADELLMAVCDECHHKAEAYVRALPEVELHLVDWSDDELPEGRERWRPDDDTDTPTVGQATFETFAPADD
jgi:5-methylcytosine-specific restriction endonuclease McrA/ribosomal protein L31